MKKYETPKAVEVNFMDNKSESLSVKLTSYDNAGIVFYDENYGNGKVKIFIPYHRIRSVIELKEAEEEE